MSVAFVDLPQGHLKLRPLTFTRPACELRVGINLIREKWERYFATTVGYLTEEYLCTKFPKPTKQPEFFINGAALPDPELVDEIRSLEQGSALYFDDVFIAGRLDVFDEDKFKSKKPIDKVDLLQYPWDLIRLNGSEIRRDFDFLIRSKSSLEINDPHTVTYGEKIFFSEGVNIKSAIINAENGPVFLGKNVNISEGAMLRGPLAIGDSCQINMGAKLRPDTTIGPFSKVGGEVSNSVIMGHSNKAHDGYLGSSVIGEWCNLGADTNNSNLKNNYSTVRLRDYATDEDVDSGLLFCGLIMGDHSKCGINTMFNTGTVVGVNANIFGGGFQPKFIPSFSWGTGATFDTYNFEKAIETDKAIVARRDKGITFDEIAILRSIYEMTSKYRGNS